MTPTRAIELSPSLGQLLIAEDGGFSYLPRNPGCQEGVDRFSYAVQIGDQRPRIVSVRIDVREIPRDPDTGCGASSEILQARAREAASTK